MTREEAIQILSTRDAHGVLCGYTSGVTEALDTAIEALQTNTIEFNFNKYHPSVRNKVYDKHDLVKVVRCKDCRHWDTADGECYGHKFYYCSKADDYCSYGERKEP